MENICKNENIELLKYIFTTIKFILPALLIIVGFIKLVTVTNTKKAIKKFIILLLVGIIIYIVGISTEKYTNNKCKEYRIDVTTSDPTPIEQIPELQEPTEPSVKGENKIENINGVTYVDGIMIVNKTYALPETYRPTNSGEYEYCTTCLTEETLNAFSAMQADAGAIGLNLYISSGFRSYSYQQNLYNNYVYQDGQEAADTYSARPGHSEHQTGLAFDLNTIDDSFAYTDEGKWVAENCYKYGLILRYPSGKESQTGYQYESWHLRYVGNELAEKLYNNGDWITLEENFNLTSVYE